MILLAHGVARTLYPLIQLAAGGIYQSEFSAFFSHNTASLDVMTCDFCPDQTITFWCVRVFCFESIFFLNDFGGLLPNRVECVRLTELRSFGIAWHVLGCCAHFWTCGALGRPGRMVSAEDIVSCWPRLVKLIQMMMMMWMIWLDYRLDEVTYNGFWWNVMPHVASFE